jgi:beta-glucosidase
LRSWGFRGFVRSDYSAVTVPGPALRAGMSLVKPASANQVLIALSRRVLDVAALRRGVASVLTQMFAFGLFTHVRYPTTTARTTSLAHTAVVLRAARQGIVLLKNANGVLPLAPRSSVAVLGVDASEGVVTRGGGSSGVRASRLETPLAAMTKLLPHARITYAPGGLSGLEFDPLKASDVTAGKAPPSELPISASGEPGKGDIAIDLAPAVTAAALTATAPGTGEGWSSWDVTFRAEKTGTYVMGLSDTGDTWLSLNGGVILADRGVHGPYPQSTAVQLVKGHSYTLKAQWFSINARSAPQFGIDFIQPKIDAAVALARRAHTAVVFASNLLTEGADLPTLYLQGGLNALISAVAAVNPRTVVVLNTGGPIVMPWKSKVAGIVEAWYGGQMAGVAMAQVLTGVVDASGRLPVTMPGSTWQTPTSAPAAFPGQRGVVDFAGLNSLGYRWYQAHNVVPGYPFGYGLSYTTFSWSHVRIAASGSGASAKVTVTNTGRRVGHDVVEVYVGYPSALGEPPAQLRGFAGVDLAPGASSTVTLTLPASAFTYFNGLSMVVAKGAYTIDVGPSSQQFVASQALSFA